MNKANELANVIMTSVLLATAHDNIELSKDTQANLFDSIKHNLQLANINNLNYIQKMISDATGLINQ